MQEESNYLKMKLGTLFEKTILGILVYRLKRDVVSTLFSFVFACGLAWLLCVIIARAYPDVRAYYKNSFPFSLLHDRGMTYNFYSGETGGVYSAIGRSITGDTVDSTRLVKERMGLFDGNDTLVNCATSGGFDNFMKVSTQKNAFGLVQEAVINLQDPQVRKNVTIETPLFMERLHIFYRKDLFSRIPADAMELSANTDPRILKCLATAVRNIEVGMVGSCTRIIASDVLDLLEGQIERNPKIKGSKKRFYKLIGDSMSVATKYMIEYEGTDHGRNSFVDIAFFVGADPTDTINNILKGKKYAMMSVHPSFMASLNKEFNLNLHVADFHGKYDSTEGINTVGTFAFLIASREIQGDDIASILKKIRDSVTAIHKSLIKLPPGCNDSCYAGTNDKCHFILPLAEFSFYQSYKATSRASVSDQKKAMVPFLIAIAGFFIPILKSVFKFKSVLVVWRFNRDIDRLLKSGGAVQEEYTRQLSQRLAVYYGNCEISDAQHNALLSRIENQLPHSGGLVTDTNKRHRIKRTQQREIDMSVQVHA